MVADGGDALDVYEKQQRAAEAGGAAGSATVVGGKGSIAAIKAARASVADQQQGGAADLCAAAAAGPSSSAAASVEAASLCSDHPTAHGRMGVVGVEGGGGAVGGGGVGSAGSILARYVARSAAIKSLTLARCELPPQAGVQLAGALVAKGTGGRLRTLDLCNNKLDSAAGMELVAALAGNEQLIELGVKGNVMDAATLAALRRAEEEVFKRWSRTDEGRAEAKAISKEREKRSGKKGNDLLDALSNMF